MSPKARLPLVELADQAKAENAALMSKPCDENAETLDQQRVSEHSSLSFLHRPAACASGAASKNMMFPAEKWEGGTRRPPVLAQARSTRSLRQATAYDEPPHFFVTLL